MCERENRVVASQLPDDGSHGAGGGGTSGAVYGQGTPAYVVVGQGVGAAAVAVVSRPATLETRETLETPENVKTPGL